MLRLVRGYTAIARLKRDATPLADPAVAARLRATDIAGTPTWHARPNVTIPCAVGFRRPMILLPAGLVASLDAEDLARVILHESAHLQRYDDWINALEQIICALQFFQPALYLARRGIDFEREVACDDRVLEDAGEPLRYAECLARIVQRHVRGRQAAVVPGFVLRRAHVVARVRRIVDRSRDASPHLRVGAFALAVTLCAATLGMARLQVPVVAPAVAAPIVADCVCPPVVHRAVQEPHAAVAPRATAATTSRPKVPPAVATVAAPPRHLPALRARAAHARAAMQRHEPVTPRRAVSQQALTRVAAATAEVVAQNHAPPVAAVRVVENITMTYSVAPHAATNIVIFRISYASSPRPAKAG